MVKKYFHLLPLIVLIITIGYAVYVVSTTDIIFGNKQYYGILFIGISVIGALIRKQLGIYLTGITLFIGTINIIAFTPAIETYSFGFGNDRSTTGMKVQLFSVLLLVFYLLLNGKFLFNKVSQSKPK